MSEDNDLRQESKTAAGATSSIDFAMRGVRPPGPGVTFKLKKYPEGASDDKVTRCKIIFNYKSPREVLEYLRKSEKHLKRRGTNVVYELTTSPKGYFTIDLRSGYFNGRGFSERRVYRKAVDVIREIDVGGLRTAAHMTLTMMHDHLGKDLLLDVVAGKKSALSHLRKLYKECDASVESHMLWMLRATHDMTRLVSQRTKGTDNARQQD